MPEILANAVCENTKLLPTTCNQCEHSKFLDVSDKWIECKCEISKPERNKLVEIIEQIKDNVRIPKWCPLWQEFKETR